MTSVGSTEFAVFRRIPVMPILVGTAIAIMCRKDAATAWVIGAGLLGMLASGMYVLAVVSVFPLVVR